jgi:hypothetical protein
MKKTVIWGILVLFLCMIGAVNATTVLLNDDFQYLNTFNTFGWNYSCTGTCTTGFPIDRPVNMANFVGGVSYMYGANRTLSGGVSAIYQQQAWGTSENALYITSFDYYVNSVQSNKPTYNQLMLTNGTHSSPSGSFYVRFYNDGSNAMMYNDFADCNFSSYITPYYNYTHSYKIYTWINPWNTRASVYVDGSPTNCMDIILGYPSYYRYSGIDMMINSGVASTYISGWDNIKVEQDVSPPDISGYTVNTMYIDENFDYSDIYENHNNWSFTSAYAQFPSYPTPSSFGGNGWGYHNTSTVGSIYGATLNKVLNITSGDLILSFDVRLLADSTSANPYTDITFYNGTGGSGRWTMRLNHEVTTKYFTVSTFDNGFKTDACYHIMPKEMPFDYHVILDFNLDTNLYSIYINNTNVSDCMNQKIVNNSADFNVKNIYLLTQVDSLETLDVTVDNLVLADGYINYPSINVTPPDFCNDSDGSNYLNYGYINFSFVGVNISLNDSCDSITNLDEKICVGDSRGDDHISCPSLYGDTYGCNGGICAVTCNETDGGLNYTLKGTVKDAFDNTTYEDYCLHDYLYDYTDQSLVEFVCSAGHMDAVLYNCSSVAGYSCFDGKCTTANQKPSLNSAKTYVEYEPTYPAWVELSQLLTVYNISIRVDAFDNEADDIYMAVQCNSTSPVGAWIKESYPFAPMINPTKCNYNSLGNKTAFVYLIDPLVHGWIDYTNVFNVTVQMVECWATSQCTSGYTCLNNQCVIPNATSCNETDGGYNIDLKGVVNTQYQVRTDYCEPSSYRGLNEYYCDLNETLLIAHTLVNCPTWQYCFDGACQNITGLQGLTISARDISSNAYIDGLSYVLTDLNTSATYNGTLNSFASFTVIQGHPYSLRLVDGLAWRYKTYEDTYFTIDSSSYTAYLTKQCTGTCVFYDDFEYTGSVLKKGWVSYFDRSTVSYGTYGKMLKLNLSDSYEPLYAEFPATRENGITAEWSIVMADAIPADEQEVWVYLYNKDDTNNLQVIMQFKYLIGVTNLMYYWDTISDDWVSVPIAPSYSTTAPFTTKIVMDESTGKFDLYFDRSSSGTFIKYVSGASLLSTDTLNMFLIFPFPTVYDRTMYIDDVSITEGDVSGVGNFTTGTLTNPSGADLDSVWYRDSNGDLKFDATKCAGWNTYLGCAIFKTSLNKASKGMGWAFSGTHLILVIIALLVMILLVPVIVELLKHR